MTDTPSNEITLETPITRGETSIDRLRLRKPTAGEMRGLKLQDILQSDVNAIIALLPRISDPRLIPEEAERLDPVDLAALAGTVQGFFMSKADQAAKARVMGIVEEPTI